MLTIGKPAEFGPDNLPVRGQCQPHTRGWRLRLVEHGREELLHTDTLYACAQIQRACAGLTDLEAIRARVAGLARELSDNVNLQETQRIPGGEGETVAQKRELPAVDATALIPKAEMEQEARKRRQPFED